MSEEAFKVKVSEPEADALPSGLEDYRKNARKLISEGLPRAAFDLVRQGLSLFPGDTGLLYQATLAMARGGNLRSAQAMADTLLSRTDLDPHLRSETLSLQGRIFKDRFRRAPKSEGKELLTGSARAYEKAYSVAQEPFPGINAATMWRLAGEPERSKELAKAVLETLHKTAPPLGEMTDYWTAATLGEAYLLCGDPEHAGSYYASAVELAGNRLGDVATMRNQLELLRTSIPDVQSLLSLFQTGSVVIFSGHLIDHPRRLAQGLPSRFPDDPQVEEQIRQKIRHSLDAMDARVGFASAGCGSDIIFAEEALKREMELHLVLPFERQDFYQTSVDYGLESMKRWRYRCDHVLSKAYEVSFATPEPYLGDDSLFEFANQVIQGLAMTRARELSASLRALVVIDAASQSRPGGTQDFYNRLKSCGVETERILLNGDPGMDIPPSSESLGEPDPRRLIRSMMFADIRGFSAMSENQTYRFFLKFLEFVVETVTESQSRPLFRNTWGDGLFLVFQEPADCAGFAIALRDRIQATDFQSLDLPGDIMIRIGIHCGPVYEKFDPVIERNNFFGRHVNRTARIEPVTMPGCIYASEQMAAMLAIYGSGKFRCEYVGREQLAKRYDNCALYSVIQEVN